MLSKTAKDKNGAVLESFSVTEIVLASNSPRRRELLALTKQNFIVSIADVDERTHPNESPAGYVLRLAKTKARATAGRAEADRIVLAADTAVVDGGEILGKPEDEAEAFAMLTRLRGHTHQVYTGLALLRRGYGLLLTDLSITDVPMRVYTDDEIRAYIATGDPLDKAGAYAIQDEQFHPVEHMSGCYAGVMGLALCHVTRMLRKLDIAVHTDVPANCQRHLEYECPVFDKILNGEM
jgi:septum formation protein